jgi:hypothetical protein
VFLIRWFLEFSLRRFQGARWPSAAPLELIPERDWRLADERARLLAPLTGGGGT